MRVFRLHFAPAAANTLPRKDLYSCPAPFVLIRRRAFTTRALEKITFFVIFGFYVPIELRSLARARGTF